MKPNIHTFHLKVQKVEQICLFELSWGHGQSLTVQVSYPQALTQLYQDWRQTYLNFYQSDQLRGRTVGGGVATIHVDWHAELIRAETKFMYEFHRWLRSAELYDIRSTIASASQTLIKTNPESTEPIRLFLTCAPIALDRFPWEAWELGTEFASTGAIQIIRSPLNISAPIQSEFPSSGRARILAILGDDTGLDFKADREAVRSLKKLAEVKFVGWQPDKTASQVIQDITSAISDEQGWDVLFFAGHSNETALTGGELGIAPGVSISINEIKPQLMAAKKRGLQVAIFNSCSGLSIADSLIDLGFGQVVVMREPIHNRVAQDFLVHFLQGLGKSLDVYDSVLAARQFLRMEKSHTYPSASLVPSLFCHPGAKLFQLAPVHWKGRFRQLLPTRIEAIVLATSIFVSLLVPVQDILRDGRLYTQAVYRTLTAQIPLEEVPPVALIQIDTESLNKAGISDFKPLDRTYLARILDALQKNNARAIGFDVLLDAPQKTPAEGDSTLGRSVRQALNKGTWIIFAAIQGENSSNEIGVNEHIGITSQNWTMLGNVQADQHFVESPQQRCQTTCPMSYLLALVRAGLDEADRMPKPTRDRVLDLRTQLLETLKQQSPTQGKIPTLLNWARPFELDPIIDFSLPRNTVYQLIPAQKLLDGSAKLPLLSNQIALVASGSDDRLGMGKAPDRFLAPTAMRYYTNQDWLTGGESLAYMTHHWMHQHLVIPIPDLWMVGVAVIFGKTLSLIISRRSRRWTQVTRLQVSAALVGLIGVYSLIVLQVYISALVLLPWLLPSSVFLTYSLSAMKRRNYA
ncbi:MULTISPECIES: CHASE2 domain-containing protein [Leptolyngbya]|uniref:CHASE2 domain-containing protein n=1 Tax=Leptolyngbya TaxID=47251 RepID=UPI0016860CFA|nr:CHASE2 domain-containing protein [Leptolyngbya sp. FACHB-1624]MBD1858023.1 CHASE2 domain-containing protein [Leptolyngbya sp. FACHB-1624]